MGWAPGRDLRNNDQGKGESVKYTSRCDLSHWSEGVWWGLIARNWGCGRSVSQIGGWGKSDPTREVIDLKKEAKRVKVHGGSKFTKRNTGSQGVGAKDRKLMSFLLSLL
jgi:hypothetical protein